MLPDVLDLLFAQKTKATTCLRQVIGSGAWPSDGIMRKVVEQMAETPYADALRLYGLTQMASFQSEVRLFLTPVMHARPDSHC